MVMRKRSLGNKWDLFAPIDHKGSLNPREPLNYVMWSHHAFDLGASFDRVTFRS